MKSINYDLYAHYFSENYVTDMQVYHINPTLALDLLESENFSENREENSQLAGPLCTSQTTLGNAPDAPNAPVQFKSTREKFGNQPRIIVTNFTCKDTKATWISGFQWKLLNFELYPCLDVISTGNITDV